MFDVIIKSGIIVDGSNSETFAGDIAVENELIKEIGPLTSYQAVKTLEACAMYESPGIIFLK